MKIPTSYGEYLALSDNEKLELTKYVGGVRKLAGPVQVCRSPEHNPPQFMVHDPGTYEYVCPSCGHRTVFTVPLITL